MCIPLLHWSCRTNPKHELIFVAFHLLFGYVNRIWRTTGGCYAGYSVIHSFIDQIEMTLSYVGGRHSHFILRRNVDLPRLSASARKVHYRSYHTTIKHWISSWARPSTIIGAIAPYRSIFFFFQHTLWIERIDINSKLLNTTAAYLFIVHIQIDRPTAIQSTDPISCVQRKVEIFVTERKIPFVSRYWIFGQTELGCSATRKKYQLFFNWTNTMFLAQLLWSDKSLLAGRPNGHCTFTYWNLVLVALWSGARTQPLLTSHYKPSYAETRVARLASPVWANNFILVR